MSFEAPYFQKKIPDSKRLLSYGFQEGEDGSLSLSFPLMDGQFKATVQVKKDGSIACQVIDVETGDPYAPLQSSFATGAFVGNLREEYGAKLEDIVSSCFHSVPFVSKQGNWLCKKIKETSGTDPEFLFKDYDFGVFRCPNQVWFAWIGKVKEGTFGEGTPECEMIDLRNPNPGEPLPEGKGIYPGYHMNKKTWISLVLDGKLSEEELWDYVEKSYALALKQPGKNPNLGKEWVAPWQVASWDVFAAFDNPTHTLAWPQKGSIGNGDILYIYATKPYACLIYRCACSRKGEVLTLKLLEQYPLQKYGKQFLYEHGLTTVRGFRRIPQALSDALKKDREAASRK